VINAASVKQDALFAVPEPAPFAPDWGVLCKRWSQ